MAVMACRTLPRPQVCGREPDRPPLRSELQHHRMRARRPWPAAAARAGASTPPRPRRSARCEWRLEGTSIAPTAVGSHAHDRSATNVAGPPAWLPFTTSRNRRRRRRAARASRRRRASLLLPSLQYSSYAYHVILSAIFLRGRGALRQCTRVHTRLHHAGAAAQPYRCAKALARRRRGGAVVGPARHPQPAILGAVPALLRNSGRVSGKSPKFAGSSKFGSPDMCFCIAIASGCLNGWYSPSLTSGVMESP